MTSESNTVVANKTNSFKSIDRFSPLLINKKRSSVINESTNLYSFHQGVLLPKRHSIFSVAHQDKDARNTIRHDVYGNTIFKGSKNHRVSFIDTISNNKFTETIIVNKNQSKASTDKVECNCSCAISNSTCIVF